MRNDRKPGRKTGLLVFVIARSASDDASAEAQREGGSNPDCHRGGVLDCFAGACHRAVLGADPLVRKWAMHVDALTVLRRVDEKFLFPGVSDVGSDSN